MNDALNFFAKVILILFNCDHAFADCNSFCAGQSGVINTGSCFFFVQTADTWQNHMTNCQNIANASGLIGSVGRLAWIDTLAKWSAVTNSLSGFLGLSGLLGGLGSKL